MATSIINQFAEPVTVHVISATDSSACAGMQADLRVCADHRTYATVTVTAVTAQNSLGVESIMPVSAQMLSQQMHTALRQQQPQAVKIGLLPNIEAVQTIAQTIEKQHLPNIIFDPVMNASAGDVLNSNPIHWRQSIIKHLLPLCTLLTPNLPELAALSQKTVDTPEQALQAAQLLIANTGCPAILIKGGHCANPGQCLDILVCKESSHVFKHSRQNTSNLRGTGCSLSTAIACYLAHDFQLSRAIALAIQYLQRSIHQSKHLQYSTHAGPAHSFDPISITNTNYKRT